jgi:hypothetical protein
VSPGNVEFVQVLALLVISPVGVATILRLDERRLRGQQLGRAWLTVTRDATVFGAWQFAPIYGCIGLIVHFTKTRWSLAGFGLGVLWAIALYAANVAAILAIPPVIDWLGL